MEEMAAEIEQSVDLGVCRDVVATQFALILDTIRDWHHIGKPLYHDKRLYEYMEVRKRRAPRVNKVRHKRRSL